MREAPKLVLVEGVDSRSVDSVVSGAESADDVLTDSSKLKHVALNYSRIHSNYSRIISDAVLGLLF